MNIYGYMHCCAINDYKDIIDEQFSYLFKYGLYESTTKIHLGILGKNKLDNLPHKVQKYHFSEDINHYEFPTLKLLYNKCLNEECLVWYIHTKGVFTKYNYWMMPQKEWRRRMQDAIIKNWEVCPEVLKIYDTCGTFFVPYGAIGKKHYAGNFWWANSNYIKNLNTPHNKTGRYDAEAWILTGKTIPFDVIQFNSVRNTKKTNIGIGITTYNRFKNFKECFENLLKNSKDLNKILIVNDCSTKDQDLYNKYFANISDERVEIIQNQKNIGVGASKNIILRRFNDLNYDYFFTLEDDINIKSNKVFKTYINAIKKTGIQHFNFGMHGPHNNRWKPSEINGIKVRYYPNIIGAFTTYTKELISKIGYYDEKFKNAWEHVEYTYRASLNNLTSKFWSFIDLEEAPSLLQEQYNSIKESSIRPRSDWKNNILHGKQYWKNKYGFWIDSVPNHFNAMKEKVTYKPLSDNSNKITNNHKYISDFTNFKKEFNFLIIGHPRTGTSYMAKLFQAAGYDVGHEKFSKDGISHWQFAVNNTLKLFCWGTNELRDNFKFKYKLMTIRNPFSAIQSILNVENKVAESLNYRIKYLGIKEIANFNEIDLAATIYVRWIKLILKQFPNINIVRIENAEQDVKKVFNKINMKFSINQSLMPSKNYNTRNHNNKYIKPNFSLLSERCAEELSNFCKTYNYKNILKIF